MALGVWQKTAVVVRQVSRQAIAKCVRFKSVLAPIQVMLGTLPRADSMGGYLDSALSFPHTLERDFHVPIAFKARELLSPLYQ